MKTKFRKYSFLAFAGLLFAYHTGITTNQHALQNNSAIPVIENIISDETVNIVSAETNMTYTEFKPEYIARTIQYNDNSSNNSIHKDEAQRALRRNLKI
ncbi:hypothetical protein MROS_1223 [Melioribacter roseus P3M-2]|uniref:Uncharacterized protein n=1 Tax=Melioribacter roseus (strain DSM 23840 / JCM 17771 / VKM B-2668 / P3M-2) TaxID=1191523 RepID=I6Z5M5_MELRP|nr:hypothetical protein [Melioribacter roseus]AFN74460.1 hypothetical protein MROS_1223 [Melioribacter roseus P3M-2]